MASFLNLFPATDPAGASAAKYRLHFMGNMYLHQDSWIFGMMAELLFTVYQVIAVPASALLGLVFSSGTWLQPLSDQYERFFGPLYEVFPPWAIACVGLAIVVVSMLNSRVTSTKDSGIFTPEAMNRLGVALAMVVLVAVLASNPVAVIMRVLEWDTALASDFATKVTRTGSGGVIETGQALVDQSIRTPAIALNYGREFSAECKQLWSESMMRGQELSVDSGCFVDGQNKAGPDTVITAFIMWFLPALPMLAFAVIAAWKYVVHISMSVLSAVSLAWVAALKVHHRRGFERVAETFGRMGAHMLMFVIVSAVTVALPATCSGIAMQVIKPVTDPEAQSALIMVTLGIGFLASTWVILKVTSNHGALVRVLKADANLTLESTLGVKPKKLEWNDFGFWKFNPLGGNGDGAGTAAAGKPSQSSRAATANTQSKAEANVAGPDITDGEEAVKALISSTTSVSDEAGSAVAVSSSSAAAAAAAAAAADASAKVDTIANTEHHYNRLWQVQRNSVYATLTRLGDVYGYYTDNSTTSSTFNDYGSEVIDGEVIGSVYDDEEKSTDVALRPDFYTGGGSPPSAGEPDGHARLLAPPEPPRLGRDTSLMRPVAGNVYADTALNDIATSVGATFQIGGGELAYVIAEMTATAAMGGFDGQLIATSSGPFAVASAPPPVVVDLSGGAVSGTSTGSEEVAGSEPINDQQRWNRAGWRAHIAAESVTGAGGESAGDTEQELPLSGIHGGVNMHPAGFMAPMRDLLSADALEAQMAEQRLVHAAAGELVAVLPPAGDSRLSVRLSSDPDERVVRVCDADFDDPL